MKLGGWVLAALLVSASASAQQQVSQPPVGTAIISGRVVDADSGKPVRGASVSTISHDTLDTVQTPRRTTTDADGTYRIAGLSAGHYDLTAHADHYLDMQFGQLRPGPATLNNPARPVNLHDDERFDTADFHLTRTSAIEGTVVDEFGDPVPNVSIAASQVQFAAGRRRLIPVGGAGGFSGSPGSDDKGHFRVSGLPPGEYYISALAGAFADANATGGFGVTFYPGVTSASAAQPVKVAPGHDVAGVQFALVPAAMAKVAGTVVDADGKPLSRGYMTLMPSVREGTAALMAVRAVSGDDGTFVFRNLPPGAYTIQVYGAQVGTGGNLNARAFGYVTFDVEGKDLDGLRVRVPAPRNIRGTITFEGDTPSLPAPDDVFVYAQPVDFESAPMAGGPPPTKTTDDWHFEVNAMSGIRMVMVAAGKGWSLHRIVREGVDITNTPIDLREQDVNDLAITLTSRPSIVSGTLTQSDGAVMGDYSVVIFAEDDTKWFPWSRAVALARPDQQGAFSVTGMPAGAYYAIAVASLPNGAWQDPEVLKSLRAGATRFSLLDSGTYTLQLKLKRE